MALLQILHYPDPRLKTIAQPVTSFDAELERLVMDMAETMYGAPGIGLAATQVNVHKRVIVVDVTDMKNGLMALVNPEIISVSDENQWFEEGCLSVPGIYDKVERPSSIRVRTQNIKGQWTELEADGLLAVCIQHEIDHLKGKVFVEYLSELKQNRIRSKLKKSDKTTTQ